MNTQLWDAEKGHYVNYKPIGFVEDHFSVDTLVALRYGLVEEARAARVLSAARQLQTRVNEVAGMGDWGVTSVLPLYKNPQDLFGKSAEPYHYHNGAEWPYWDGVYAQVLQQRNDTDWRYVLTRWWVYGLAHRWLTPVEYYSPRYPHGGMLQGWSAMPAAALVAGTLAERTHGYVATGPSL